MPNMSLKKVPMPEQEPNVRNHNFQEVSLGYTKEMAMEEAARCLNCKHKPCVGGCPVNIRIPEFIAKVAEGDFQAAYDIISDTNALPSVSGRVCPQESQCEARCVRAIKGEPVAIGRLERFVADWYRENVNAMPQKPQTNGIKVAVVGSGPASLTCASDLAKHGYEVTIFEAFHTAGGVLVYGIPEFRLPKAIVQNEVDKLTALGVDLETDMVIGKTFDIDEMFEEGYEAVFIGSGAGLPMFMGIEGETLAGVYSANEYLTRINLMKAYREGYDTPLKISGSAAIIGGGNVAMDAARCAKRMGAEHVYVLYRRDEEEMPARKEEVHHAKEEGIEFMLLTNPVKVLDDGTGRVGGLECVKMRLTAPDESGRRAPKVVEGSNFTLEVDTVVMSLGTSPNPLIRSTTPGLETNRKGCLQVDEETMATSRPGVYAGGDAVTGAATVILAGLPMFMGIEGETLAGVYSANEYLTRINLMKAYREGYDTPLKISGSAAIIGGGNVAMDAARCAKRMGAEHVYVLYRRDEEEMPARKEEVHHAKEEGIEFMLLTNPVKVLDDGTGRVGGLECVKMRLTAPDESGRRAPKVVEGSNFTLEVDTVVMSLGTSPNPLIRSTTPGLETNRKGCLQVDEETMATSRPGVYAGGDAVTGAATVILAMGAGKKAAESMHQYLQEKHSK